VVLVALAGGVGAARLLRGMVDVMAPAEITAVVNTGDDWEIHGLSVCPDLDTVTYTLAGVVDPESGWGREGESWEAMAALERYQSAAPPGSRAGLSWFALGDRDLATHLYRTQRLDEGAPLSQVTAEIAAAWGIGVRLLPMTDDPVATMVTVPDEGEIGFQDYFVRLRHDVATLGVRFAGASSARPAPGVLEAIGSAETVVISPSNPVVSVGPILALPGVEEALVSRRADVVAVSPIVAGAALKGPAARLLADAGHEVSVTGIARLYAPLAGTLVIDEADASLSSAVERAGMRCVVAPALMHGPSEAAALAQTVLNARSAHSAGHKP